MKKESTFITARNYTNVHGLEGKYINRRLYSDVDPVGKIIATRGNNFVTIQPVYAGENKEKMEFVAGGFSAICINDHRQSYDFYEHGDPYEIRLSKAMLKRMFYAIQDAPSKYYDYNF